MDNGRRFIANISRSSICLQPSEIYDKYIEILSKMDFSQKEAKDICKNNALKMINLV